MRENGIRAKLAAGATVAGLIVPVAAPVVVDLAGLVGFDFVLIDTEHGHLGFEAAEHLVRAAEAAGITPLARPSSNTPAEILRLLDLGVQGVMIPQITTEAEAERAVRATKFHPRGERGLASSRAAGYGLVEPQAAYVDRANAETMVIALIEHIDAVARLDAIIAVDGIDVLFIGASDLAQSMGHPGHADHADVQRVVDQIIDRGLAAGRVVGVNATSAEAARVYAERGVRFFCLSPWHHAAEAWRGYLTALPGRQTAPR